MLSNPHWDAPSLSSFESWLETKDPQEEYKFTDWHNCACAQYLKHVGKFTDSWLGAFGDVRTMNALASDVPQQTFGALLARVRKYRALVAAPLTVYGSGPLA